MALLEELRAEFSDHDTVLHLLLGLVSLSRRLEQVLPEPPVEAPAAPPAPTPEEERRVLLLLGLVSVRRTVMGTLEPLRAASAAVPPEPSGPVEGLPGPRELLR